MVNLELVLVPQSSRIHLLGRLGQRSALSARLQASLVVSSASRYLGHVECRC